jgi:hypothetical protein
VTVDRTFLLSRIYAEGWNAAIHLPATECDDLNLWKVAALNPYADEPERSRWSDGFAKALGVEGPANRMT